MCAEGTLRRSEWERAHEGTCTRDNSLVPHPRALVWRQVWEIRGADITVSPVHKAAVGHIHPDRGLSLRFPRFIRKRPDKGLREATTPAQLAALYSKQASVAAHASSAEAGGGVA